jgi:hypothetical protein
MLEAGALHSETADMPTLGVEAVKLQREMAVIVLPAEELFGEVA